MVDVTRIHEIETDLALVSRVNSVFAGAVAKLAAGASLEAAAQAICDELCSLPAVDVAAVGTFVPDAGALILAASAVDGIPIHAGYHLPAHRTDARRTRAARFRSLAIQTPRQSGGLNCSSMRYPFPSNARRES
jgi:hypothetical protein